MCTSNAYAHSTKESEGVEWEGGERSRRLAVNQRRVAITSPERKKSRKIMSNARMTILRGLYEYTRPQMMADTVGEDEHSQ